MHTKLLSVVSGCLLAAATQVAFAGESFPLTPQTVANWTVVGTDQAKLAEAPLLVIPAGAQVARGFKAKQIAVNLDGGVVFDADPANWPVLEIGAAALAFVRNGETGGLSLMLGDNAPVKLPYVFKLDAEGRSIDPVHLTFVLNGNIVAVTTQEKLLMFSGDFAAGDESLVVVSAGRGCDLALANFAVTLDASEEPGADASTGGGRENFSATGKGNPTVNSGSGLNSAFVSVVSPGTGGTAKPTAVASPTPGRKVGLVVFSPSAYRLGRADAIRAAAASTK